MKKYFLFFLLLACSLFAHSQEIISENSTYFPYQDTLFVLRTITVTNMGIEGVNDTTVIWSSPTDTAGVAQQIEIAATNSTNAAVAKFRNAISFRSVLANYLTSKNLLALLGIDLDERMVARYGATVAGRYRVFRTDGTNFFVNVAAHPTNPAIMRATGTAGEGNFNVLIYGRWMLRISLAAPDGVTYLIQDRNITERPILRHPSYWIPTAMVTPNNTRMVKL